MGTSFPPSPIIFALALVRPIVVVVRTRRASSFLPDPHTVCFASSPIIRHGRAPSQSAAPLRSCDAAGNPPRWPTAAQPLLPQWSPTSITYWLREPPPAPSPRRAACPPRRSRNSPTTKWSRRSPRSPHASRSHPGRLQPPRECVRTVKNTFVLLRRRCCTISRDGRSTTEGGSWGRAGSRGAFSSRTRMGPCLRRRRCPSPVCRAPR